MEEILEEDIDQELDMEEMSAETEGASLGSSGSGRDPAIQPVEAGAVDSVASTMPITLNRPAERPVTSTPDRRETPDVPTNAPASTAVASPWGSVPESNGANVVASNSRMRVQSTPSGAQVFVDGAVQGTTPADFSISRGAHLIAIEKDGFVRYTENVTVQHDSQMIRANLEPVPQSEFQVVVSFYGASGWRVFESNAPLCTIPCSQQLSTGVHEFRVVNDSDSWVVTREITGDYAGASVGVNLQRD